MSFFDLLSLNYDRNINIIGVNDNFFAIYLTYVQKKTNNSILVVVNSLYDANKLYSIIMNYTDKVNLFPMDDFLTSEALAISPDLTISRLETLNKILDNPGRIVITNLMGYLRYLPTVKNYCLHQLSFKVGDTIDRNKFINNLLASGYSKNAVVSKTGEFAVRGFIIDVFPLGRDFPIRIELFDDEIESIRVFEVESQKSIESIKNVLISPFSEFITDKEVINGEYGKQKYLSSYEGVISIKEYLGDCITVFKDYNQLVLNYNDLTSKIFDYKSSVDTNFDADYMFSFYDIKNNYSIYYSEINNYSTIDSSYNINYKIQNIKNFNEDIDAIKYFIDEKLSAGYTVFVCLKDYQLKKFASNLKRNYYKSTFGNITVNALNLIESSLPQGFIFDKVVVLTAKELFNEVETNKKYNTHFKYSTGINDISKLNIGDYIVHHVHGIGIYNGLKTLSNNGIKKDYIELSYQGNDKIYVPVEKIDSIFKYSSNDGAKPKVSKLGGNDWQKTKARVKKKINDMADKLLKLYAEREQKKGYAFSKDNELNLCFENAFPYELTKDQKIAIEQIKNDMESSIPMDRLLCGDVGFGKTEVAFVAAFKAVMDSKQVFLLCPTTILSNQHYDNALIRFQGFPVNIALLNRFTSTKEYNNILEGIKNGTIDMVIGTHRLLNDNIVPKDLGLLIIDEEQRFGVAHKEKIKQYKVNVDVLTLTATPIPRTLQMSLVGIRSLSLIETPPVNRYPVQTYVIEENLQLIKDAIYKEMARDGQVFILYNRVESIEDEYTKIKQLVPDSKITIVHGRMTKSELEERLYSFINKQYDVLICTTIIETGIDIPNVNTLIIIDADRFGLGQLYQIRGRVGRSDKFAYAYLMYKPFKTLTDSAVKRLNVIKEFTELGSGFSIATRDLSIRGAGDLLGSEQAGFIDSVGIDLYLKMLNDAVKNKTVCEDDEIEKNNQPLVNVSTHINDNYVFDDELKIQIHKKINEIDSYEKMEEVKTELEDRFGRVDEELVIYMYEEWFEKLAAKVHIEQVKQTKNSIELIFGSDFVKKIKVDELFISTYEITNMFRFYSKNDKLSIILDIIKLDKHPIYYLVKLLNKILDILS